MVLSKIKVCTDGGVVECRTRDIFSIKHFSRHLIDISKAFDKVWHDGLIFKLKQNGVSGSLLMFFQNYLNNRKQRVVLNGSYSSYSTVQSGVPQGSVLGPLLFLIYINDLEGNIKSNVKFFADDTMLYSIVNILQYLPTI